MTDPKSDAKVSVVVPVYNGARTICATVERLLRQSLRPHEVIVVDDGSTDGTAEVLKAFGESVLVISKPNGGPASARNSGIRAATGDFVAFTDGDCLPDPEWLANLLKGFDAPEVGGVGGVIRRADEGLVSEYVDLIGLFNPGRGRDGAISYLATGNACFRREALLKAGLFDETFRKPGGEEPELCTKIKKQGYVLRAVEDAVVLHHHKQSAPGLLKAMSNYGEGSYILEKMWPEHKSYENPRADLVKSLILTIPRLPRKTVGYSRRHGLRRGILFTVLDYFRGPAYAWGYVRAMRNDARKGAADSGDE